MARPDAHHEIVKRALSKDGWQVTRDHLSVKYGGLHVQIDLAAEKQLDEARNRKAAIEVKVFEGASFVSDFEKAVGQYSVYRFLLRKARLDRELFLAVTDQVYSKFFGKRAVREYILEHRIRVFTFNIEKEEVVQWIK